MGIEQPVIAGNLYTKDNKYIYPCPPGACVGSTVAHDPIHCIRDCGNYGKRVINKTSCGFLGLGRRGVCEAVYEPKVLQQCIISKHKDCHPKINDTSDLNTYNKTRASIYRDLITGPTYGQYSTNAWSHINKWKISNNQIAGDVAKQVCNDGKREISDTKNSYDFTDSSECKKWCKANPDKCPDVSMRICNQNFDNKNIYLGSYKTFCSDLKDTVSSIPEEAARSMLMRKEYEEYKIKGQNAFSDPNLIKDSEHIKLPENVAKDYDLLWENYCKDAKDGSRKKRIACACYLSEEELKNQGYATRPDCLSKVCATNINSYRPYKTVRTYTPQCLNMPGEDKLKCVSGTCPNVCSQVIQARAGNISIIKNIHLIQNCFSSQDSQVIDLINKEVNADISVGIKSYMISCIYTSVAHEEKEELEDKDLYMERKIIMTTYITNYSFIAPAEVEVMKTLIESMDSQIFDARKKLKALRTINWSDDLPKEKVTEYEILKKEAVLALSPFVLFVTNLEKTIDKTHYIIKSYNEARESIINEANQALNHFKNTYLDIEDTNPILYTSLLILLEKIETPDLIEIYDLDGILLDLKGKMREYIIQVDAENRRLAIEEEKLLQIIENNEQIIEAGNREIIRIINTINQVDHKDNNMYKEEWSNLLSTIDSRERGDPEIIIKINDFKSRIQGFIKMKEGTRLIFDPKKGVLPIETPSPPKIIIPSIPIPSTIPKVISPPIPKIIPSSTLIIVIIIISILGVVGLIIGIIVFVTIRKRRSSNSVVKKNIQIT